MILLPPGRGYWMDSNENSFDSRGKPLLAAPDWQAKFETDDTAKCYRRFFVGRVSSQSLEMTKLSLSFRGYTEKSK